MFCISYYFFGRVYSLNESIVSVFDMLYQTIYKVSLITYTKDTYEILFIELFVIKYNIKMYSLCNVRCITIYLSTDVVNGEV